MDWELSLDWEMERVDRELEHANWELEHRTGSRRT